MTEQQFQDFFREVMIKEMDNLIDHKVAVQVEVAVNRAINRIVDETIVAMIREKVKANLHLYVEIGERV